MSSWNRPSGLLVAIAIAALLLAFTAGCGDTEPTSSPTLHASLSAPRVADADLRLAECGTTESASASALIGSDGGLLSAGPAAVFVPPEAVETPTRFTIQPLAGGALRVRITAQGQQRVAFARPIAVMIGYQHCARQEFLRGDVSVWHVDDDTDALLERMPTVNDRDSGTLGFLTTHLSTYAVAH